MNNYNVRIEGSKHGKTGARTLYLQNGAGQYIQILSADGPMVLLTTSTDPIPLLVYGNSLSMEIVGALKTVADEIQADREI